MQFGSAGPASGSYLTCTYLNSAIGVTVEQPFLLVTHNNFYANNLPEFIAYAKTNQSKTMSATGAKSVVAL